MNKHLLVLLLALGAAASTGPSAYGAQPATERQKEVAERGAGVMPFDLKATTHIFTKTGDGGRLRVIAKDASDASQIALIRSHLQKIQTQFKQGDFSAPSRIHGAEMPGLAELQAAKPGDISIDYRPLKAGAELTYKTKNPKLLNALHAWFDAQLSDHGTDAMQGHQHHGMH